MTLVESLCKNVLNTPKYAISIYIEVVQRESVLVVLIPKIEQTCKKAP